MPTLKYMLFWLPSVVTQVPKSQSKKEEAEVISAQTRRVDTISRVYYYTRELTSLNFPLAASDIP